MLQEEFTRIERAIKKNEKTAKRQLRDQKFKTFNNLK